MRFVERLILNRREESVRLRCPAKVNLFLKVTGKRGDGYHEVQNVMQTVTLYDELEVRRRGSGVRLTCSGREVGKNREENLAFRAAEAFLREGYGSGGVDVELRKNIPVAAGLGGGSSDGACCLLALNEVFGTGLSADTLRSLAAELGSDVPFFIEGGTALCTGRGEIVRQLRDAPRFGGVLAGPGSSLKTVEMYASLVEEDFGGPKVEGMLRAIEEGDLKGVCSALFNGFERAAFERMPELREWRRQLGQLGSMGTVLCGSGPTLLAIFPGIDEAEAAARRLRNHETKEAGFTAVVSAF
jgi:4-diphosphocytidyl-2-C-methyl-D-erythritol kinase